MKRKLRLPVYTGMLFMLCLTACKPAASVSGQTISSEGICNRPIQYKSEKVIMNTDQSEIYMETSITVNPAEKRISLFSKTPEGEKMNFDFIIESTDCSLDTNLTSGKAAYTGYIKQQDGEKTFTTIIIEPQDGVLRIGSFYPPGLFEIVVKEWSEIHG